MRASPDDIGGEAFSGLPSHLEAFAGVSFGAVMPDQTVGNLHDLIGVVPGGARSMLCLHGSKC